MYRIYLHKKKNPTGGKIFELELEASYLIYVLQVENSNGYICSLAKKGFFGKREIIDWELFGPVLSVFNKSIEIAFDHLRNSTMFGAKFNIDKQVKMQGVAIEWVEAYRNG